jgi:hypothetical protein
MQARLGGCDDDDSKDRARIGGDDPRAKVDKALRRALFGYAALVLIGLVIYVAVDLVT